MKKLAKGERVAVYGYGNNGRCELVVLSELRETGTVADPSGVVPCPELVGIKLDTGTDVWVHVNQCRRLKTKAPKSGAV